jgi:hypothetical protein
VSVWRGSNYIVEEEQFEELKMGRYYPVNIGDIFNSKYQVVGKLCQVWEGLWAVIRVY